MENRGDDHTVMSAKSRGCVVLSRNGGFQRRHRRIWDCPGLAILRDVNANDAGSKVDASPLELQRFALAPTGPEERGRDWPQVGRELVAHSVELLEVEETPPNVVFAKQREVGPRRNSADTNGDTKAATQHRQLAIDGGRSGVAKALSLVPSTRSVAMPRARQPSPKCSSRRS
jgi:hypothetical protein